MLYWNFACVHELTTENCSTQNPVDIKRYTAKHKKLLQMEGGIMKNSICMIVIAILFISSQFSIAQIADTKFTIAIDSVAYIFNGYNIYPPYTIHNKSDSAYYFWYCADQYAYYLQQKEGASWIDAGKWGVFCQARFSMGYDLLLSDSSHTDYANISKPGTYRLILRTGTSKALKDSIISPEFLVIDSVTTDIKSKTIGEQPGYWLSSNFPNPFNPKTEIRFSIPKRSHVLIEVFSVLGQRVARIIDETKEAGIYNITLSADNMTSGTYFVQMKAGEFCQTQKINVLK